MPAWTLEKVLGVQGSSNNSLTLYKEHLRHCRGSGELSGKHGEET